MKLNDNILSDVNFIAAEQDVVKDCCTDITTSPRSLKYSTGHLISPLNRNNLTLIETSLSGPRSEIEFESLSAPSSSASESNT